MTLFFVVARQIMLWKKAEEEKRKREAEAAKKKAEEERRKREAEESAAKAKEQAQKAADAFDDAVKEARQKIQNGTATIQDYVNSGRETLNRLTRKQELPSNYEKTKAALTSKSQYSEYRDDDSDFAEKNYSKNNHVEDTDFYTFKRPDGRWVILEEDMKWVLPEGVTGNDPGIKNALKNFSDQVVSTRSHGGTYTADQWVDDVTAAIDKAAERQFKKK